MVSLRRRKNLGYTTGLAIQGPMYFDDEGVAQLGTRPANLVSLQPISLSKESTEIANSSPETDSLKHNNDQENGYGSNSSDQLHHQLSPGQQVKHRSNNKRKQNPDQELANIRGVYCKNMKWQAAIKVKSKQVHLGTLDTQAEATRIYDRAAFVCGRTPNFELPEEEKEELKKLNWDEFLEKTKVELTSQRKRKHRTEFGSEDKSNHQVQEFQNKPGQGADGASASSEIAKLE